MLIGTVALMFVRLYIYIYVHESLWAFLWVQSCIGASGNLLRVNMYVDTGQEGQDEGRR